MNKLLPFALLLLIGALLSACGGQQGNNALYYYQGECDTLAEFYTTVDYCQKFGLPVETFGLQYPVGVNVQTQAEAVGSPNYVSFFTFSEEGELVESMNVGYFFGVVEKPGDLKADGSVGLTKAQLLQNMVNQLSSGGLVITDATFGEVTIRGAKHVTARGKMNLAENTFSFKGNYLVQMVMMNTGPDHGITLIMMARDDSGVRIHEDFEFHGCMAPILNTIQPY